MASKIIGTDAPVITNLRRAFENAVRNVHRAGLNSENPYYRRPIVQRPTTHLASSENAEKRALSDAAKALAQLWKVVPGSSR